MDKFQYRQNISIKSPLSRYAAKPPKRFRSKVNKVIVGRNNKVNFTSKSCMTAGRISERILADKLLARVVVNRRLDGRRTSSRWQSSVS